MKGDSEQAATSAPRDPALDAMRITACLAVVLLHVSSGVVTRPDTPGHWWVGNLYDSLVRFCIPAFVMLSGALMLGRPPGEPLRQFYLRRGARVLWPYLFGAAMYFAWTAYGEGQELTWQIVLQKLLAFTPFSHLYFLGLVLGLYLVTPAARIFVHHAPRSTVWATALLLQAIVVVNLNLRHFLGWSLGVLDLGGFLGYLPYYLIGYLLREPLPASRRGAKLAWLAAYLGAAAATALAAGAFQGVRKNPWEWSYHYQNVFAFVMALAVFVLVVRHRALSGLTSRIPTAWLGWLSRATLAIYVVHYVFIYMFNFKTLGFHLNGLSFHPALAIPFTALCVLGLSLPLVALLGWLPGTRQVFRM